MKPRTPQKLKFMALAIAAAFVLQDVAAAIGVHTAEPGRPVAFGRESVLVDETHVGDSDRLIYLIQDAHTNPSSALNTAKVIRTIMEQNPVGQVFVEGGSGDDSLTFLKSFGTASSRWLAAISFLNKGLMQGAEFENLLGERDFVLWGVEDKDLYARSLEAYRFVLERRSRVRRRLAAMSRTLRFLKDRLLGPSLKSWDELRRRYHSGGMSVTEYAQELLATAERHGVAMPEGMNLELLNSLSRTEETMDFERAGREKAAAEASLGASPDAIAKASDPMGRFSVLHPERERETCGILEGRLLAGDI
ncbi:MAG: hypothetical protein HQL11_06320, partial [Candidatus Omnitrophica bacterium]|nr:hypothetical protein [Candidatus Omnitrophota bacterium]